MHAKRLFPSQRFPYFVLAEVPYDVERDDNDDGSDGGVDAIHEAKEVVPACDGAVERRSEGGQSLDNCLMSSS